MLLLCTFAGVAMDTHAVSDGEPGEGTADWPTNATPPFPPSYRTNDSTILYWRNGSGFEPTTTLTRYGLFLFDWAHAANVWINDYSPMDTGAVLQAQCEQVKAVNPHAKCVVYRNTVKAMNQYADVSALVDNPAYAGFFLPWKANATQTGECDIRTKGGYVLYDKSALLAGSPARCMPALHSMTPPLDTHTHTHTHTHTCTPLSCSGHR